MHMVYAWRPGSEQGLGECQALLRDIVAPDATMFRIEEHNGMQVLLCSDKALAERLRLMLEGMNMLIDLLGPCEAEGVVNHAALLQLRRLVYGNLGCVEPKLGPYVDEISWPS